MLFTDTDVVTADALAQIDSEVSSIAKASKPAIAIDGPGSICGQAWRECGQRITSSIQMYTSYLTQPGMSGGHVAAVLNIGTPARTQPRARLQQIVATDSQYGNSKSTLETWMAYRALALFFRDASSRLGKDRFEEKYERYLSESDFWWRQLRNNGLPFIWQPLEAPAALHGFNPGTWGAGNLTGVGSAAAGNVAVQVAVTYCDVTHGYVSHVNGNNAESGPSAILSFIIPAAESLKADIASLVPPNGPDQVGLSQGMWTPMTATHWNLWVGAANGSLYLQRELIPIGTKQWTLPGDPVLTGTAMGNGQWADLNMVFQNVVMRG